MIQIGESWDLGQGEGQVRKFEKKREREIKQWKNHGNLMGKLGNYRVNLVMVYSFGDSNDWCMVVGGKWKIVLAYLA